MKFRGLKHIDGGRLDDISKGVIYLEKYGSKN